MKSGLTVKILGEDITDIRKLTSYIEQQYKIYFMSRLQKNNSEPGYHVFLDLIPENGLNEKEGILWKTQT